VNTPPSARAIVNRRPAEPSGRTSWKPTVVIVITVMYSASSALQPSTGWSPSVPTSSSAATTSSGSWTRGNRTRRS